MEVGVDWDESPSAMAGPNGVFQRYVVASGFAPSAEVGSAYDFLPTMKKASEHGEKFMYVAPVTDALGWLVERVCGKSYTQLLNDEIISKLNLEGDG
ncbi:MAG: hydrolase, partial [Pseudomonadota bacterium]|nr:hydrolase [Pseudomonadota bacterium]